MRKSTSQFIDEHDKYFQNQKGYIDKNKIRNTAYRLKYAWALLTENPSSTVKP